MKQKKNKSVDEKKIEFIKDYTKYVLCAKFGWTEEEINNTSVSFIKFCIEQLQIESENEQKEFNKIKNARY